MKVYNKIGTYKNKSTTTTFNFEVGQKFKSFKEFESQLKHYQDAKFIQLYRRSSCNIESTKTKQTITNNNLIFSELKYTCIHGDRNCVSNSKGSRPNQRQAFEFCLYKRRTISRQMYICIHFASW
jgi:zinc finger SWIM domain-containing protein 3